MKAIVAALATCLIGLTAIMVMTQDDRPGNNERNSREVIGSASDPPREYGFITAEDLMTDNDAFYSNYLNPDPTLKAISEWPIVKKVVDLGIDVLDAGTIADRLNRSLPADTQDGFADIKEMVDSCAEQLGITPPRLFIENDPHTNAYVTRLQEPHLLVLTSSLYNLYQDNPEELRFIIGHELGHLKCNHIRCHTISRALMHFIVGDRNTQSWTRAFIADQLVGKLMAWHREAEISADRAGLLCVNGDLDVAQRALLRLMHGTKVEVDPNIAARDLVEFEKEPFVKIVRKIRSYRNTHPFIPDRCLALRKWITTDQYARVTQRSTAAPTEQQLVIEEIRITGLPELDDFFGKASDPIITASVGAKTIKSSRFDNDNSPNWVKLNWTTNYVPNSRIIINVEEWDDASPNDFMGACILPIRTAGAGTETIPLRPTVNDDTPADSLPQVTIKYKVVAPN